MLKNKTEQLEYMMVDARKVYNGAKAERLSPDYAIGKLESYRNLILELNYRTAQKALGELDVMLSELRGLKGEQTRSGEAVARQVSYFINGARSSETDKFIKFMENDHRTLQQSFTKLCMKWLNNLAEREHYDDRNKASVELAKMIKRYIPDYYKELPLI